MNTAQILRPAGIAERRCIARDVLGHYGSIVLSATYQLPDSINAIPKDDIIKALKQCIRQHPSLSAIVLHAESEKPQWAKVPSLNLDQHLRFLEPRNQPADDEEAIREMHGLAHEDRLPNMSNAPPWRVYVTSTSAGFRLAFSWSHSLGDGRSGCLFHSAFLKALRASGVLIETVSLDMHIDSTSGLQSPFELTRPTPISWAYLLRPLLKTYAPKFVSQMLGVATETPKDMWFGAGKRPALPSQGDVVSTSIRMLVVEKDTVCRVLEACRRNRVRLTGLLNQLIARAVSKALHTRGQHYLKFSQATAIDLRRCIPEAMDTMGNYASCAFDTICVSPASSEKGLQHLSDQDWSAARHNTEHLARTSGSLTDQPLSLLKYLTDFRSWLLENAYKPAEHCFELSNVGVFDVPGPNDAHQEWTIQNMVFSASADCGGAALNFGACSVKGGCLSLAATWWPGMLDVDDEEAFVEEVLERVRVQLEGVD